MTNTTKQASPELSNEDKMARGSAWMTIGNIGSRLLGVVYILPWYYWLGENRAVGNTLFNMGYTVYALFIMISTAGIPAAIAKQIAFHNSRKEYRTSQRLFLRAVQFMIGLGVVSALVMYILAPALAKGAGGGEDLIPSMRSLSVALLVIPVMSVIRGYFQGINNVAPYAISQLVEQIVRVVYILGATFIIMKLGSGNYVAAVTQSTFAAFIGALAGLLVLIYYFRKEKIKMDILAETSTEKVEVDTIQLLISTVKEAIPFIILGAGITIYKLVDQYTFVRVMSSFTEYSNNQLLRLMALFNGNPDKLSMVVIGLATSVAIVGLPLITESFAKKDKLGLAKLVSNNLQLYGFIMLPATFGMILLAYPINSLFYDSDRLGANLLIMVCLSGLIQGLFMVTSTMLQGIYENTSAVIFFAIGLIVKIVTQSPMIYLLESYGPIVSTTLGLGVTCYLNLRKIRKKTHFNSKLTTRRTILIALMTAIMMIFAGVAKIIFGLMLNSDSKLQAFILIILVAGVGGFVYIYMALKIRLADKLLGSRMAHFRAKLRIK
uniref:putative polysaccharide biosynthesis protein n=1 Tax=Candidatus Enterococcus willemsii TaxID=1857215 RepID=UPI00403F8B48